MSKDAKNVPALRFKGYSDAWEKRKLGDLGSVAMNKRIYKDQTSDEGEIPFYKIGSFGKQADAFISRKLFNEYKKLYPFPKKGDILISASGSIGRTIVYNGEDAYFQDSNIIWIQHDNRLDNTFLHQLFNIIRWSGVEGTTIKRLYNKNILSTQILLPSVEEQRSIGNLLDNVDNLIAATQHNIDALEQAKKALLQRLFDQSWRFKGYSDPWEKRKLGEVATITMGQSPDSKNYTLNPQDHILVQGNADIKNGWVEPRVWTTQITKIAKKGSVLLSVRAPVGEVSKTAFDVVLGRGVASVGQTDFLYQYLITLKINGFWLRYSTGSTFDSINSADIKDAIIFLPEKNEQSRIAKTLNCIDNLIAATQSRLSSLELLKKALLQDLFI
ncbi:restriction endonuclease subunit S [Lacticaseibacillus paracasei]|uniref:restriction endonuclease subunit S n=1 Tax=Lacticaseibacillus paracasei TaxID=1597 RepID=UPI000A01A91B|nr:restriction endonuclease subunit S [Lacticaseibacillus paracasei]ORI32186.1 type IC specificity subunit protein [Lacticaseibacillus casei]WCZ19813.1 restriction endonuclease subunit S [Lacticaseibacillus paracasei]